MSSVATIVQVTIDRQTKSVARASFGTPAIVAQFAASKTTAAFGRVRFYASLAEMTADGWTAADSVYRAAQKVFGQNPSVSKIMVGRKDSTDADWATALGAMQLVSSDWYGVALVGTRTGTLEFSTQLITGNIVTLTVNGTALAPITYATDHATTMAALESAIEAALPGAAATVSGNTISTALTGTDVSVLATVTGGSSQPTVTTSSTPDETIVKAVAAWVEAQRKVFAVASDEADILDAGETSDLFSDLKALAYERTFGVFSADPAGYADAAWLGRCLPNDPGSQTWAYKVLSGVTVDNLTTGQENAVLGKNANFYTVTGGVNVTQQGKTFSGEYIDVIRSLDWLESRIQEEVFSMLVNRNKVPYDDGGITLVVGAVERVLDEAVRATVLAAGTTSVTAPRYSAISAADKADRILPDVSFNGTLVGSIQKVNIEGVVSL